MDILNFKNYNLRNLGIIFSERKKIIFNFIKANAKREIIFLSFLVFVIFSLVGHFFLVATPFNFPVGIIVKVNKGESTQKIAKELKEDGVIKSELMFELIIRVFRGNKGVMAGDYFFENPRNLFSVASRLSNGFFGLTPVKITILEGLTVKEMSKIFAKKFPEFNSVDFLEKTSDKEGFLFPDTYSFLPNVKAEGIIKAMEDNFYQKIEKVEDDIENSGYSLKEIITMASILEEEGITFHDRKMISGVLWNRIKIGMPLQVDAVFPYIIGKNTYQVSLEDLKTESPYNTYIHKGLPPGPITNPGFNSIVAALNPTKHNYLYYLSDRHHNVYYAETFEGHKRNRMLYLGK